MTDKPYDRAAQHEMAIALGNAFPTKREYCDEDGKTYYTSPKPSYPWGVLAEAKAKGLV